MTSREMQSQLSSPHQILVITRLTLREAQRRKMLWIGLGLGLVFVAMFATGFHFAYRDFTTHLTVSEARRGFQHTLFANVFLTAALYVVNFLIVMVAALTTVGTISGEIDSNTIHAIAAKPIRRWEIILGRWLGHALMLIAYTVLLGIGVMLSVLAISGYWAPGALLVILVLMLESLTVLSLTMLGSTVLNTLANGVVVFMLYGLAFVGGWVEQFASLEIFKSQAAIDLGIAASLLMPSEALWRFAASLLADRAAIGINITPFSVLSKPSPAFIIYSGLYVLGLLAVSMWAFNQRDF